jgi:histidine triad (HIT) family protein
MDDTLFSKIIRKEIPAEFLWEDSFCAAFKDIHPQAPTHVLVVPKKPVERLAKASDTDKQLIGHLLMTAAKIAAKLGVAESGYRVVINNGPDGGETVPHLHVHLLAGRAMQWPPG